MAQYRQLGTERNGTSSNDHTSIGIRSTPYNKQALRARRSARPDKASRRLSIGSVIFVLYLVLLVTMLAYFYISGYNYHNDDHNKEVNNHRAVDDDSKNDLDFLTNVTRTDTFKVLGFGKGSIAHGRDSRYWDKDDRRRDDDYNEDLVEHASMTASTGHVSVKVDNSNKKISLADPHKGSEQKGVGLYNEAGRTELKMYEEEYEASLKTVGQSKNSNGIKNQESNNKEFGVHSKTIDVDDEYDDNIEFHGTKFEEYDDSGHDKVDHSDLAKIQNQFRREYSDFHDAGKQDQNIAKKVEEASSNLPEDSSLISQILGNDANYKQVSLGGGQSNKATRSETKKKAKRHKFSDFETEQ